MFPLITYTPDLGGHGAFTMGEERGNELENLERSDGEDGEEMGDYYGIPLTRREIRALEALAEVLGEPIPPRTAVEWPSPIEMTENLRARDVQTSIPLGVRIDGDHVVEMITWHRQTDHNDYWPLPPVIGTLRWLKIINNYDLTSFCRGFDTLPETERFAVLEILHNIFFDEGDYLVQFYIERGHVVKIDLGWEIYLTQMPASVANFSHIREIEMTESHVMAILEEFGQLKNLERLDLSLFWLKKLPESFGSLKNLKYLRLDQRDYPLTAKYQEFHFPSSMVNLQRLETLILTNFGLESVPEFIGQLRNLKVLDLSGNKMISAIPRSFYNLPITTAITIDPKALAGDEEGFNRIVEKIEANLPLSFFEREHPRLISWATRVEAVCIKQLTLNSNIATTAKAMLMHLRSVSLLSKDGEHILSVWL